MPKRIAMYMVGLLLALGAFLLYEYFGGGSVLPSRPSGPVALTSQPREDEEFTYEVRRPTDDAPLEYILRAKKAKAATSADGSVVPGKYILTQPSARYYTTDGRLITLRGDTGTLLIDSVSGPKTKLVPRGGSLSGHVVITFGPQDAEGLPADKDSTITVKLSKDLQFDYVQRILRSPGEIQVRSNQVAFDGEDLTIAFNPDERRLEYFRIDKGNKIILKNIDPEALALGESGKGATTQPATAPAMAATAPGAAATNPAAMAMAASGPAGTEPAEVKRGSVPTAYKLAFGQNVEASLGNRKLTSEGLYVLFMAAAKQMQEGAPAKKGADAGAAGGTAAVSAAGNGAASEPAEGGGDEDMTAATEPMPAPKLDDLVITWTGPMEMRPAGPEDVQLSGPRDKALEAVGTKERPVEIHDDGRTVVAGRLWLHSGERRLEIEPGELGMVTLADPTRGTVTCQGISVAEATDHCRLLGPGRIEVPQGLLGKSARSGAAGKPLAIRWQKTLDLDLIEIPDVAKGGKKKGTTPGVRRAVLTGDATIDDANFQLVGNVLDVLVANTKDPANPQAIEHVLATGNVTVKSMHPAAPGEAAVREPDGISGQRLELLTSVVSAGKAPVPSKLVVDGDVMAWSYRNEKPGAGASAKGKPRAKQTIYAPHLEIALAAKSKTGAGGSAESAAMGLGDYDATSLVANGGGTDRGVKVELEHYAPQMIIATARSLEAAPQTNEATLMGSAGSPATVTFADNTLSGGSIVLDQNKKTFRIPGAGQFLFTLPANKERKVAQPMQVTWTGGMLFDSDALLATFDEHTVARMIAAKASDSSQLTADHLAVKLRRAAGGATQPAGTQPVGEGMAALAGSSDLTLDTIMATGNVSASGSQTGPDNKVLTQMLLLTEKLAYEDGTHRLTIPGGGKMVLIDNRPEKGGATAVAPRNGRGETAFEWAGSLVYNQEDNTVELSRRVHMVHQPTKPIRLGSGGDTSTRIELNTEHLVAKLSTVKDLTGATQVASPVGVGNDGNQQLEHLRADGGAVLTLDSKQELRANVLTYDNSTHIATAIGTAAEPVTFTEPEKRLVQATGLTWDMATNAIKTQGLRGNMQLEPY